MKIMAVLAKFIPGEVVRNIAYSIQRKKRK